MILIPRVAAVLIAYSALTGCLAVAGVAAEPAIPKTLNGMEFRSVKQFQVSVLPTGSVKGHRTLKFEEGRYTYMPADFIETGKFDWDAKRGEVEGTSSTGKKFKGKYDPKTKILTWDGVQYKVEPPKKKKEETTPMPNSTPTASPPH